MRAPVSPPHGRGGAAAGGAAVYPGRPQGGGRSAGGPSSPPLVFGVAGSTGGLGWYINNARYYLLVPDIFAGLIAISILGIAVDLVFGVIEQRTVVRWGMKTAK